MGQFKCNYNKRRFKKIICKECGLCKGKPKFCFDKIYKNRPYVFIAVILPKLIKLRDYKMHCPEVKDIIINLFCNQFICAHAHNYNKGCYRLSECVKLFESQFMGGSIDINKNKPVKQTPSFFCNTNNEAWLKEIESYA